MYDAIIIGARCGGAPLAMLLARQGQRVLLVDKCSFPSDTMSTHYVKRTGASLTSRSAATKSLASPSGTIESRLPWTTKNGGASGRIR